MNITIKDNMGTYYRSIFNNKEVYVAENGCVITGNPLAFHIPMKAANGELLVAHGVPGVPMEVGKLLLATIDNHKLEDITGYKYINKNLGLTPNNLKIVPAEESELDLRRDFILNKDGMKKLYLQKGMVTGFSSSVPAVTKHTNFTTDDVVNALINGGGYATLDGATFSINRYFKTQPPHLTREGIIRIGQVGCYNRETGAREFGAGDLSTIWEMATEAELSNKAVYKIISDKGSWVSDNFAIKFSINGEVLSVEPIVRPAPLF